MNFHETTKKYYAKWLGADATVLDGSGVEFVYSAERDNIQKGYTRPFHIFAFHMIEEKRLVISYGERAKNAIDKLKATDFALTRKEISAAIEASCGKKPSIGYKYVYNGGVSYTGGAVQLAADDFPRYMEFFEAVHPNVKDTSWVREYFDEMTEAGLWFAVEGGDGRLLSVADSPDMPFMDDIAREVGIYTLPEARGRGFAKIACLASAQNVVRMGICPIWSTSVNNPASDALAKAIGFSRLAETFTVTLD